MSVMPKQCHTALLCQIEMQTLIGAGGFVEGQLNIERRQSLPK